MIQRFKKKLNRLREDPHMQEVARGTALAFALKLVGSGLAFAFNVALARLLGTDALGVYFLALSIVAIASVIARLGLDNALLRFISSYASQEKWGGLIQVYGVGIRWAVVSSFVVTVTVFISAPWLAELQHKPDLAQPLRWMSLSILPFALLNLHAESLKGLKRIRDALLVQGVGMPLLCLLLLFPLVAFANVEGAAVAYSLASFFVMLLSIWFWNNATHEYHRMEQENTSVELWESCKPLWIVSLMNRGIMPWAPILSVGFWLESADVGVFSAATRVALLVSFFLVTVNNVIAPKFSELYTKGDMKALGTTARKTAGMIALLVLPLFLGLFLGRDYVMGIFGQDFVAGSDALAILLLGQYVNVLSGAVGFLLMMSGNEKIYRNIAFAFALIQIILIVLLTPLLGVEGSAAAAAIALAGMNIAGAMLVYRKLGIMILPGFGRFV